MYWQYRSDLDGSVIKTATSSLISSYSNAISSADITTPTTKTARENITTPTSTNETTVKNVTTPNLTTPTKSNKSTASRVNYPVRFVYVDSINNWSSASAIAAALGVPGYAKAHTYNYIALAFWSDIGPLDILDVWSNPTNYFGT